ncbi:ureF protein [Dorcoceras hygrometricum]|uniref:UreF protein n=1 Tax=Dorcoceras hygrometricum TaxID=472368 RepID=A0A2Z7DBS7_9LAMI|nr:ureF protein [Dorcoceras hygrometricum]KZV57221.1 ureF protein [Dorcoceras hygrometricum]
MEVEGRENDLYEGPSPASGFVHLWSQWQLLDSILPTGGFAHSLGLESATQARLVVLPDDLQTYVIHVLENTGSLLLPFVYAITISPDEQTWHKLDKLLNATLTNDISRKASMSQGSALMRVAAAVFSEIPLLKLLRSSALASGLIAFHYAPIFGLVCALLGFGPEIAQRAYMFVTMRDVISAATRLNLVGPLGAAVMQHRVTPVAEELSKKWMNRTVDEACQGLDDQTWYASTKLQFLDSYMRILDSNPRLLVQSAATRLHQSVSDRRMLLCFSIGSLRLPRICRKIR